MKRLFRPLVAVTALVALASPAPAQISTPAPSPWAVDTQVFGDGSTLGTAIAMTSTVVVLGEPGVNDGAGQVRILKKDPLEGTWNEVQTLTAPVPAAGDHFGAAVALHDKTLVVSAPDRGNGVVYVYLSASTDFFYDRTVIGDDDGDAGFGDHLGFDGATLAVASPRVVVDSKKGRVYVFAVDGTTSWERVAKLSGSQAGATADFGATVAVAQSMVVVGDPSETNQDNLGGGGIGGGSIPGGINAGAVYVFDRDAGGIGLWGEQGVLVPSNSHPDQRFGAALAVSSTELAVGAPGDDTGADGAGAVYHYYLSPGGSSGATPILPADPRAGGAFGRGLAFDTGRMAVASLTGDPYTGGAGPSVYVLERPGLSYEETSRLYLGTALPPAWGLSLAIVGNEMVVGAPGLPEGATLYRKSAGPCDPNPCLNDGICDDATGEAVCDCRYTSFWGDRCETPIRCGSCIDTAAPPDDTGYSGQDVMNALGLDAVRSRATGAGVRVAIVGYGADFTHADAPANLRLDLGWDFVDGDADPSEMQGPGTAILGAVAAATDNALGIASLAPDAEIIPVRVIDGVTLTTTPALVAAGIDHVRDQAEIILVSVGGLVDDPALRAAVTAALDADRVVIAPAGGYPGSYVRVTAVGGLSAAGDGADTFGGLYAPPYDLLAPDGGVVTLAPGGGYGVSQGEGVAPALVAATAAVVWSASDFPSAATTRDAVEKTAGELGISGFDQATGHGALRPEVALSFRLGCANCIAGTDPCSTEPCQNGGACTRVNDTQYECACPAGFTGPLCNFTAGTACETNVCQNGGDCFDNGSFVTCSCKQGYYGPTCADSDCIPNPCGNDGVCTNSTQGTHFCLCQPGFGGTDCADNLDDPCDPDPCQNGTCSADSGAPVCACDTGWTGDTCAEDVNECSQGVCEQLCTNLDGGYFCECTDGYAVQPDGSCEDIDECATANGGCAQHCENLVGASSGAGYLCSCDAGYALDADLHGCVNIDDCADGACGAGTCVDGVESYTCDCGDALKGDACQLAVGCSDCPDAPTLPDDPLFLADEALTRIGAPWAWTRTTGAPTVRVAIVSTGIDASHPDAPDYLVEQLSFDLVEGRSLRDQSGLGTYVAGLLAAPHNGTGVAGVAPNVEVTVMKVTGPNGSATSFLLAQGITTAVVTGAQIILVPAVAQDDYAVVRDAVASAVDGGRLVIAPASGYPGRYEGVLSVGPLNVANFDTPDLVAPDVDVTSTWPGARYESLEGAAPTALVGGAAALVWSVLPDADASSVRQALLDSAESADAWSPFWGYGTVRADSAVGLVLGCGSCGAAADPCAAAPCEHGTCTRTGQDTFTCACGLGYSGDLCDQQDDPCVPNPCQKDGTCSFDGDALSCDCPAGYGGARCQYELGECSQPASVPGCDDPEVEACVCDLAPQCCTVKWGDICAQLAGGECAGADLPPSQDEATRACVCAQIPDCCEDTWKPICDEVAQDRCEGRGDCSAAHQGPGCDDPEVEACVCDQEPLCCSYTWDTVCAKYAVRTCGDVTPGGDAPVGACDVAHAGTGCDDAQVESCVCGAFPHCCSETWDVTCAKQAVYSCMPTDEGPPPEEPPPAATPPAEDPPSYEGPSSTLGPCCEANTNAKGCDEPVTEACVCGYMPECCVDGWSDRCALIATEACGAFCDPNAPPPQAPPNTTVPDPIDFPDIPTDDPCFGAVASLTSETCLSVDYQRELEDGRRLYEEQGLTTPCLEEKANRCGTLMKLELDARFADAVADEPVTPDLVIRPFTVAADFLASRQAAVVDPTLTDAPAQAPGLPRAASANDFALFSADVDVNSCAEYAFQTTWDYQLWRTYPESLFSRAYGLALDGGGIGRRGLAVENNSQSVRRTVRTLHEARTTDYAIQGWERPELRREFAAPKNGYFALTSDALREQISRRGGDYALLVLLSSYGTDYYEDRALRPWHWHLDISRELTSELGWTGTDLLFLDGLEREFTALVREWATIRNRRARSSTPPEEWPTLDNQLAALALEIGDRLKDAADLGCLDLDGASPCDWSYGDFLGEVESFYEAMYQREYQRCLRLTGDRFDNLTWLRPDTTSSGLQVVDLDPRDADTTFVQYLLDLDASVRRVAGNVADDLDLAGGDVDETELGNDYFGVSFGWDNRYRMKKPALNVESGACDFDAEVSGDFHVVGQLLGDSYDLYRAEVAASVSGRTGYGRVVLNDEVLYTGGDADGNTSQHLPLNLVVEPTRDETSRSHDFATYDEWIAVFWVPIHLYAGITGQLGADLSVKATKSGFNLDLDGDTVCHDDFELEVATTLSPFAGVYAKASASIGVPGFQAGIGGDLTLIEGSLPFATRLAVGQRTNTFQTGLPNLGVTTRATGQARLTAFKGDLYAFLDYPCNWGIDTCTSKRRLARAKGWTRSIDLFPRASGTYDVGQVSQVCAAVAEIPNDVLDCEGAQ